MISEVTEISLKLLQDTLKVLETLLNFQHILETYWRHSGNTIETFMKPSLNFLILFLNWLVIHLKLPGIIPEVSETPLKLLQATLKLFETFLKFSTHP